MQLRSFSTLSRSRAGFSLFFDLKSSDEESSSFVNSESSRFSA
jgi:hypothetical protein